MENMVTGSCRTLVSFTNSVPDFPETDKKNVATLSLLSAVLLPDPQRLEITSWKLLESRCK